MTTALIDVRVDIHSIDDTGYVWAFTSRIMRPHYVQVGAVVIAGNATARSLAQVVDVVDEPSGAIVHLRLLDGNVDAFEQQRELAPTG